VELEAVLVTACGVESEATTNNFAVAAGDGAGAAVRASQLMGQGSAPHSRVTSGAVEVDAATVVNGVVDLRGFGQRPTVLAITVDDLPNIDNASALAPVVESVGGRLSFFVNSPELVTDARRAALRELAAAGHEIGGHARTNGRLTQEIPLVLRWDGAGSLPVTVSEDGAALTVGAGAAARTWALGTGGLHSLRALCAALGEVDGLTCTVVSTDPSAVPTGADPTGLESGTRVLGAGVDTDWPWDRRLPSAGGRHFRNELVRPRELLSEWIGAEVRTLAYPGQKHDAWVREVAADAGFWSARGGSGFTNADHRLWAPFDPFQAPMSLSVDAVKGPGYAALDRPAREERVRAFARAWSAWAREVDAVGALTIHSEGTFSPEELGWLVDALAAEAGWHPTLGALRDRWEAEGLPLEDGRWQMPGGPVDDIVPGPRFAGRDRAPADAARTEDAAGRPIYGAPDIGPFEHQPTGEAGRDGVPFRVPVVVYADGRFDGSPDGLPLGLAPAAVPAAGPRPAWATLTVDGWSAVARRFTVAGGAGAGCLYVGDLGSGASWAWTAPDGTRRTVRADGEGRAAVAWKGGAGAHSWTQGGADAPLAQTCGPRGQDDAAPETPPQEVAARRGAPAAGGCAHAPLGPVGGVLLTGVALAAARRRRR
jgi:peptidoglycan/xylan/chitin deacetylase (PgdA/CDA1 family)